MPTAEVSLPADQLREAPARTLFGLLSRRPKFNELEMDVLAALRQAVAEFQVSVARGDSEAQASHLQTVLSARQRLLEACGGGEATIPSDPGIAMLAAARRVVASAAAVLACQPASSHPQLTSAPASVPPSAEPITRSAQASPTTYEDDTQENDFTHTDAVETSPIPEVVARLLADRQAARDSRATLSPMAPASPSPPQQVAALPHESLCIMHALPVLQCRHLHAQRVLPSPSYQSPPPAKTSETALDLTLGSRYPDGSPAAPDSSSAAHWTPREKTEPGRDPWNCAPEVELWSGDATLPVPNDAGRSELRSSYEPLHPSYCSPPQSAHMVVAGAFSEEPGTRDDFAGRLERDTSGPALGLPELSPARIIPWDFRSGTTPNDVAMRAACLTAQHEPPPSRAASSAAAMHDSGLVHRIAFDAYDQYEEDGHRVPVSIADESVVIQVTCARSAQAVDREGCHNPHVTQHVTQIPRARLIQTQSADIPPPERSGNVERVAARHLAAKDSERMKEAHRKPAAAPAPPPHLAAAHARAQKLKELRDASREQARKLREASLRRVSVSGITTRVSDALQLDPAATAALSYAASAPPPAIPSVASMRPIPDAAARFHEHALEVERLRTREAERLRAREADARRDREIWEATEREQQAAAAAEAHQRARERARKAKEALAEQAARERAEAAEKEARKWEERDRKVQRFLQRKRAAEVLALASAPSGGRAAARQAPTIAAPTFRPTTAGPASSGGAAVDESLVARVVIDEGSHTTAIALEAERQYLEYPRDAQTTWAAASATSATAIAPPSLTGFVPSSTICDASATHDRLVGATPQDDSEGAPACALPVGTAILQHIMRRVGRPPGTESAANTTLDPDVFLDQLTGAGATQCLPETQLKDAPKGTLATGGQIVSALLRPKRAAPRKLRDESVILSGAGPSANNAAAASSRSNDADAHATVTFARHSLATTDVRVVALLQAEVAESAAAPAALIMSPPPPTMANAAGPLSPWILPSDSILLPADDEPRDEDALIDDASSSILLLPGDCRANGVPNQSPFYWGPWSLPSSSDHVTVAATSASVPIPGPAPPPPLWAQPFRPRQVLEADHDLVPGPQAYGAIASKQNVNLSRLAPALPVIGRSGWPDASGGPQCLPVRSENVQNASGQSAEASEPLDITFSMLLPADMPVPWRLAES